MSDFFVLTFLVSLVCLVVFLIKPKFRTKKYIIGAVLGIVISFFLVGVTNSSTTQVAEKRTEEQLATAEKKVKEEQQAKEKAEAEKKTAEKELAKVQAEAEKKNNEEQQAKEKAETEKKAKEEQLAKEQAEAEKKAKEEQLAKEKAETEKKAKEEQLAQEQAEAQRKTAEEQLAREQVAATQAQQTERTVYIAPDSGTKYHYSSTCRGLKRANSIQSLSLSEAIAQNYTLCGFED